MLVQINEHGAGETPERQPCRVTIAASMPTPAIYGALVGFTVQVYSNVVGDNIHFFVSR